MALETESRSSAERLLAAVRSRRKELGLTQQELADLSGVSTRFLHDVENGKVIVQFDLLLAVADTLGLQLHWHVRQTTRGDRAPA